MMSKSGYKALSGVLILDKPFDISSNQILQRVRHLFQAKKAGHTGSLDVLATGLLPICFGEATKFSQFLLDADKSYLVTMRLGKRTTTLDAEGEVLEEKSFQHVTQALLEETLPAFLGVIEQIPPMYSALKHQGQPLYKLARKGQEIERKSRQISIYNIQLLGWEDDQVFLKIDCSKGTYIRTLVDDIGQALGCGAFVAQLHRVAAGPFRADQMLTYEQLMQMSPDEREKSLLSPDVLIKNLPKLSLETQQALDLQCGKVVNLTDLKPDLYRLYSATGFLGVGDVEEDQLKARRLMAGA